MTVVSSSAASAACADRTWITVPGLGDSTVTAVSCTADANDTMMPTPGLSAGNCWRYSKVRQLRADVAVDDARHPACVVGIAGGVVDLDPGDRDRRAPGRGGRRRRSGRARRCGRPHRCRPRSPARRGRRRTASPPATPTNPSTRSTAIASPASPTSSLRRRVGVGRGVGAGAVLPDVAGAGRDAVGLGREQRDAVVLGHDLVEQPVRPRRRCARARRCPAGPSAPVTSASSSTGTPGRCVDGARHDTVDALGRAEARTGGVGDRQRPARREQGVEDGAEAAHVVGGRAGRAAAGRSTSGRCRRG